MSSRHWSLAGLCLTLPFLSSCTKTPPPVIAAEAPAVAVAKVQTGNVSQDLVLTAEFKPYQEVDVMAKVAGYIKEINVDVGDRVRAGQPLATLEIPEMGADLQRADASVDQAQAETARARDELQRTESAHQIAHLSFQRLSAVAKQRPGLIAQQEIDDAQSKDLVTEAQVASAKSSLAVAGQQVHVHAADVQRVKMLMEYTRVTAPFAGVVTKRYADKGAMIQAGTASQTQAMPVVRISDNSRLRLVLPVPESVVPNVRTGESVEVRVPTLNRSFPGKVARFSGKVAPATRTMDTEVDVENPNLVLMPGMYAEVNLTLAHSAGVLTIPVTALDQGQVMVVTPNNRVEVRKIQVGLESADKVQVRSGLNEGDLVVIAGRASLHAGDEVRPKISTMAAVKE
jgi:RND family efflux transporter MFP subunit